MQSREINILKGTLPILVVLIHSNFLGNVACDEETLRGFVIFRQILQDSVLSLAVPAFFFMSGYLFYQRGPELSFYDYKDKMKRRARTLLIPYLIWNIFGLLLLVVKMLPGVHQYFPQYHEADLSTLSIIKGFWTLSHSPYPYDMPLWFIRNLIVVQCCGYAIGLLLRYCRAYSVVVTAAGVAMMQMFFPDIYDQGLESTFLFFTFGGAASCWLKSIFRPMRGLGYIAIGYLVVVACYIISGGGALLFYLKTLTGIFVLCRLAAKLCSDGIHIPHLLTGSAFFVYAFHGLFVTVSHKLVTALVRPTSDIFAMVDYALVFIMLYGVSLVAYLLLNRFFPSFTKILCGGR